jgi:hypothetical protein
VAWVLLCVGILFAFVTALPGYREGILHPTSNNGALKQPAVRALLRAGITLGAYAWMALGVICLVVFVSLVIGVVVFLRRGDDWMALAVSLFLIVYPVGNASAVLSSSAPPQIAVEVVVSFVVTVPIMLIFYGPYLLFPTGRFVPRWSWVLLLGWVTWFTAFTSAPPSSPVLGPLVLGYPLFYFAAIVCQVYRFRVASTPTQRLQTKWVVSALVVALLANQIFWLPVGLTPLGQTLYAPIAALVYLFLLVLVPVAFFVAIQRYHLYDIDVIIRRTLIYGALTAILAALYFGLLIGINALLAPLLGRHGDQPLITVGSTLIIAALFSPLRHRIQAFIDRRFYRAKYDASATVAGFGASVRDATDLSALSQRLVTVVDDTVRPVHVSLWLNPNVRERLS